MNMDTVSTLLLLIGNFVLGCMIFVLLSYVHVLAKQQRARDMNTTTLILQAHQRLNSMLLTNPEELAQRLAQFVQQHPEFTVQQLAAGGFVVIHRTAWDQLMRAISTPGTPMSIEEWLKRRDEQ